MRIAIIGHGPSLLSYPFGKEIDDHDVVVRMKASSLLPDKYPHIAGGRTDVVVGSVKAIGHALSAWPDVSRFWAFHDTRTFGQVLGPSVKDIYTNEALCKKWVGVYREMRATPSLDGSQQRHQSCSDDMGHLHCSAGLFAVLFACHVLSPTEITLYGYDNIRNGGFTWSLTRGPEWDQYPDHNWETEARMLPVLLNAYSLATEPEGDRIRCFSAM